MCVFNVFWNEVVFSLLRRTFSSMIDLLSILFNLLGPKLMYPLYVYVDCSISCVMREASKRKNGRNVNKNLGTYRIHICKHIVHVSHMNMSGMWVQIYHTRGILLCNTYDVPKRFRLFDFSQFDGMDESERKNRVKENDRERERGRKPKLI